MPPRAQRFYNLAMLYEAKKEHERARKKMESAIRLYPAYAEAYSILGTWYFQDHQFRRSADIFREAIKRTTEGAKRFSFPLAKSLVYNGELTEGLKIISGITKETGEWKKLREQALFMQQELNKPKRDTAFNLGIRINSADADMFPWISADGKKLYFTRRTNKSDEDFYFAIADSCGGWFKARNMGSPPNTPNQEAAQMISADEHYLFFMQCENRSQSGWEGGGCDLYMSYTADSVWSVPQSFGATINSPNYEGMPCLSPDNRELYFVSDRPGGFGGMDIWVSRFENGLWREPKNLGPQINTSGNETAPFMHIDNNTFYFSSNGHTGMGGADLFMSKRINDTIWAKPVNLGFPINTSSDETGLSINVSGQKIYFASDRNRIAGDFDIYEMKLPQTFRPVPVNMIKGFVHDSITEERLTYASIYVKNAENSEELYHFISNRGDGSFMITLPAGKKYLWHTDRVSYQSVDDLLDLTEQNDGTIQYNIALLPNDYVAPVNDSLIASIYFPHNRAKLTDADKKTIRKAIEPWLFSQSGLVIFVNGYTDNTGTPMINEQLSYMRAGLVAKELTSLGIYEMSIQTRGWGEADPMAENETEEGRSLNRRVEIIIRR